MLTHSCGLIAFFDGKPTTDETAEKGGTTINALIVGTKKVDVHSAWTVRKTLHEGKSKEKGSASHDEEPSIDEFMN